MENPERFDPSGEAGTLIDSEHRARYYFGAQVVEGKEVLDASCGIGYGLEILSQAGAASVTGVDISAEAIGEAKSRFGKFAAELVEADLRKLPFEDDSFDAVVSFETIEHIEEPKAALAEIDRVLRPDGILVISSPNPDGYVGGNEHHVHEFRPAELRDAVGGLRKNLAGFRQDAWLGSAIRPIDDEEADREVLRTGKTEEEPPYSIVVASDEALPKLHGIVTVGGAFDVRWWSERVNEATEGERQAFQREVQAGEREQTAKAQLIDTSEALLEANRELAQVPVLEHRLATLEELHRVIATRYNEMLESTSWKITAPLRRRGR
jgi:ubiquinone/menaquinone biosynthesis C-methylase UbiE